MRGAGDRPRKSIDVAAAAIYQRSYHVEDDQPGVAGTSDPINEICASLRSSPKFKELDPQMGALQRWVCRQLDRWLGELADALVGRISRALEEGRADALVSALKKQFPAIAAESGVLWKSNMLLPDPSIYTHQGGAEFAPYSTCSAADFFHPRFAELCAAMKTDYVLHRKVWEWVYILHTATARAALGPGKTALGFGVGSEPISAAIAALGCNVLATDAPEAVGVAAGWTQCGQLATGLAQIASKGILDEETLRQRVRFLPCDMRSIPADFRDFDFCWSSCCLEHLGSLQAGLDFVEASLGTLRVGGIACHTTEFNLSSNGKTVEDGPAVLYRRRDFEALVSKLRAAGHEVDTFSVAPDSHPVDGYVDLPPYASLPHLRLRLLDYISTSAAIVVRRGV